jgi:MFS family permease
MNVLITATLLPSVVAELGAANLMSWPTTAFVVFSIIAASGTSLVSGRFENRRAFSGGAVIYAVGAVLCAYAPSIGFVIAGRFVQGLGDGLLSALAYVLVRNAFPELWWPRAFGLLSGVWWVTVQIGPPIGGVFASYGHWRSAFVTVAALGCLLACRRLFTPSSRQAERSGHQRNFFGGPHCLDL